jgi:hypothetical protein
MPNLLHPTLILSRRVRALLLDFHFSHDHLWPHDIFELLFIHGLIPRPRLIQWVQYDVLALAVFYGIMATLHVIKHAALSRQLGFPEMHLDDLGDRH